MESMTDEKKQTPNYDAFMKDMKEVADVGELEKRRKDPRKEILEKAKKEIKEYGFANIPEGTPDYLKPADAKSMDEDLAMKFTQYGRELAHKRAANNLQGNLDSIIESEIPEKNLERMAGFKEVAERASAGQRTIIDAYNQWQAYVDLAKRYEEGKEVGKEEAKKVREAIAIGAGEAMARKMKDKGYDSDIQAETESLMQELIMKQSHFDLDKAREYGVPGLNKMAKDAKSEYDRTAGSNKMADISRKILREMTKGDAQDYATAMNVIYSAAKKDK